MKIPPCPLWPRAEDSHGSLGVLSVLVAAVLLAACFLVPVVIFAIAEGGGGLDFDAVVGSEPALQDVGPLAPVYVEVNARGLAYVCGKRVTPPGLRELLRRATRILPDQQVIFKFSSTMPMQHLGPFVDACMAAGIRRVNIIE